MKERRTLCREDLRQLCIQKNWYTRGTNSEYEKLLELADCEISTATIVFIAEDILKHSETEYPLECICFEIARICYSYFVED